MAFLISELNLNESMHYTVSKTILQWARENECKLVISSGSISTEEPKQSPCEDDLQRVYGVASPDRTKGKMRKVEIPT